MWGEAIMMTELKLFFPVAKAIEALFYPYAEVVIHDLKKNWIAAIFNNYSKRKVGDDSLLGEEDEFDNDTAIIGPYQKLNYDGKKLKSITSILRNSKGKPIGLLCINLDVSIMAECKAMIEKFLNEGSLSTQPAVLFKNDWQERINYFINVYLQERHLNLSTLTAKQKKQLVEKLYKEGAFEGKNAAQYIADRLNISRACVYNYLNETIN